MKAHIPVRSKFVFGPQGCGKTSHAAILQRSCGALFVVDDFDPKKGRWQEYDGLYLISAPYEDEQSIHETLRKRMFSRLEYVFHLVRYDLAINAALPPTYAKESNPKEAVGDTKVPLWLCSAIAMAHWAAAQAAGLLKYGAWNWRAAGVRASTYISAMKRHLGRWENGERLDPVDGTHHLGNIMACCAILLEAEAIGKLNDDRAPSADLQKTFDEVEATIARLREKYADRTPKHWTINDEIKP